MPEAAPALRRDVLRLAVPAFATLVAEPLFLLADSAIVGHLGTAQLAGLGVAGAALVAATGLFVFLAYGTTAVVARTLGARDLRDAVGAGLDGVWLALVLGTLAAIALGTTAEPLARAFGASPDALGHATTYLRISALGLPGALLALASTGILRGLQDTRTPLVATTLGFGANIALNLTLVYGLDWGMPGSAWGTVAAQTAMGLGLFAVVVRAGHRLRAPLRPHPAGLVRAALDGLPLLVRTIALRAVLLLTAVAAARLGDIPLAAYQVSGTVWSACAYALDALAIAGQALTGRALGAGDVAATRAATALMTRWGVYGGLALGAALLAVHTLVPAAFTTDDAVRAALAAALFVVALGQPLAGYAFVLDGVLIGAGDGRWLARAQVALLAAYLPLIGAVLALADPLRAAGAPVAVAAVWVAFCLFMALRAALLRHRARTDRWLVTGLPTGPAPRATPGP